jgi:hypothetical protein
MSDCPICEGSQRIQYADVYANRTQQRFVLWELGREIDCGCAEIAQVQGEAS